MPGGARRPQACHSVPIHDILLTLPLAVAVPRAESPDALRSAVETPMTSQECRSAQVSDTLYIVLVICVCLQRGIADAHIIPPKPAATYRLPSHNWQHTLGPLGAHQTEPAHACDTALACIAAEHERILACGAPAARHAPIWGCPCRPARPAPAWRP